MPDFLTDYHDRLEAFRTGALLDHSGEAAPLFPQPVAFTPRLEASLLTTDDRAEVITAAHKGLVAVAGPQPVKAAHTFDFGPFGLKLRCRLSFARSVEADAAIPVVTMGFRDEL